MAERRMFALKIIDSDVFLDMPQSTQNLYFHLSMRADDDGFIGNPKKIMRMIGAQIDDMKILITKRFILEFDTGIVVIKHWRIHNYIAKDRYTPTIYKEEKDKLFTKSNGAYTDHPQGVDEMYTPCIQNDDTGKVRKGKVSEGNNNIPPEKNKYDELPEEAKALSSLLAMLHTQNVDNGYKVKSSQLDQWACDIDKLHRLDGRGWKEIESVIRWTQTAGCFWSANIISGSKLREKFPTLTAQMNNPTKSYAVRNGKDASEGYTVPDEVFSSIPEDMK